MTIPPSYFYPVDRLKNGPDFRRKRQPIASFWPAAIVGGLSGGAVAFLISFGLA